MDFVQELATWALHIIAIGMAVCVCGLLLFVPQLITDAVNK